MHNPFLSCLCHVSWRCGHRSPSVCARRWPPIRFPQSAAIETAMLLGLRRVMVHCRCGTLMQRLAHQVRHKWRCCNENHAHYVWITCFFNCKKLLTWHQRHNYTNFSSFSFRVSLQHISVRHRSKCACAMGKHTHRFSFFRVGIVPFMSIKIGLVFFTLNLH